jgi:D-methionine transport system permease protein
MTFSNLDGIGPDLWQATLETLYMVGVSSLLAVLLGIPLGVLLFATGEQGLSPRPTFNRVLGFVVNVIRSIPFIILLVFVAPITRAIVGTTIGSTAAIVPLTIAAVPFLARLVEAALKDVSPGKTEAAVAMGAGRLQITRKVLLPEARGATIAAVTVLVVAQIGNSAMAGVVGGGGLGDFAIRYGYQRFQSDVMLVTVILLVVIVQAVQYVGDRYARSLAHR